MATKFKSVISRIYKQFRSIHATLFLSPVELKSLDLYSVFRKLRSAVLQFYSFKKTEETRYLS